MDNYRYTEIGNVLEKKSLVTPVYFIFYYLKCCRGGNQTKPSTVFFL